jgi:hypothetical protein
MVQNHLESVGFEVRCLPYPDLAKWLHRIDVDTLLPWGENDGLVPPRFGAAYEKLIPSSKLGGPLPPRTQPDARSAHLDRVNVYGITQCSLVFIQSVGRHTVSPDTALCARPRYFEIEVHLPP